MSIDKAKITYFEPFIPAPGGAQCWPGDELYYPGVVTYYPGGNTGDSLIAYRDVTFWLGESADPESRL